VAVESTYNWYWLVDGLQDAGFALDLVNTAAVKQYDGLKYSGDFSDARHLAHLLRLGILPTGYIYPREERAVRDLLRKRAQLVRQRSTQILRMSNLLARNLGGHASGNEIKHWSPLRIDAMALLDEQKLAMKANLTVMRCLVAEAPELDTVGNRGFSGAANAARGQTPQGAQALILMGNWCAAAQPMFENQVCGNLGDREDRFGRDGNTALTVGVCLFYLTGVANG
jgi:transposase